MPNSATAAATPAIDGSLVRHVHGDAERRGPGPADLLGRPLRCALSISAMTTWAPFARESWRDLLADAARRTCDDGVFPSSRIGTLLSFKVFRWPSRHALRHDEFRLGVCHHVARRQCRVRSPAAQRAGIRESDHRQLRDERDRSCAWTSAAGCIAATTLDLPLALCCMATTTRLAPDTRSMAPPMPGHHLAGDHPVGEPAFLVDLQDRRAPSCRDGRRE